MKIVKYSACAFILTLLFVSVGAKAVTPVYKGFMNFTIKRFSKPTEIYTVHKNEDCYQWLEKTGAHDDITNGGRAIQGSIDNYVWIDLPENKPKKYPEPMTYYGGYDYTHYVKATKSTASTVSYWGFWYWDQPEGPVR